MASDRYRKQARRLAGPQCKNEHHRNLLRVRDAHLRLTAFKYDYRRVGAPFVAPDGSGPLVWWLGPPGWYLALYTPVLPEPLRQKVICDQILHMSGVCRICGARAELQEAGVVCEHDPECSVRDDSILESAEASAN